MRDRDWLSVGWLLDTRHPHRGGADTHVGVTVDEWRGRRGEGLAVQPVDAVSRLAHTLAESTRKSRPLSEFDAKWTAMRRVSGSPLLHSVVLRTSMNREGRCRQTFVTIAAFASQNKDDAFIDDVRWELGL